jgi:hypothetical protein
MTTQRLKQLIKESIEEVIEESTCPFCSESAYETGTKCNCKENIEDSDNLHTLRDQLKQKLNRL